MELEVDNSYSVPASVWTFVGVGGTRSGAGNRGLGAGQTGEGRTKEARRLLQRIAASRSSLGQRTTSKDRHQPSCTYKQAALASRIAKMMPQRSHGGRTFVMECAVTKMQNVAVGDV